MINLANKAEFMHAYNGNLYYSNAMDGVYCYDLKTGKEILFFDIKSSYPGYEIYEFGVQDNCLIGVLYNSDTNAFIEIVIASAISVSECNIILDTQEYIYDGTEKTPKVTVYSSSNILTENVHYVIHYSNNVNAGTAIAQITGINAYKGCVQKPFIISKAEHQLLPEFIELDLNVGDTKFVSMAYDGDVSYSSEDDSVVTVNEYGLITAVSEGTARITVTAPESENYRETSFSIIVQVANDMSGGDESESGDSSEGSDNKQDQDIQEMSVEQFVTRLYEVCLNRKPDAEGKNDWVNRLVSKEVTGIQAAAGFIFSAEFMDKNLCDDDYIEQLYKAFMGRVSDSTGKAHWIDKLKSGVTREEVFNGFAMSVEFQSLCSEYDIVLGSAIDTPKYGTVPMGICSVCGKLVYCIIDI